MLDSLPDRSSSTLQGAAKDTHQSSKLNAALSTQCHGSPHDEKTSNSTSSAE